jgi:3'-phosphoadenosine 5'-phosphosulfate sulfotransferase (PAPS reductase)/FAD synthetase
MEIIDIHSYDHYIVTFSGGKDSTASFLHLLDLGVPRNKIELWHHLVDGKGESFMDWEVTEDYCRKFAAAFGVPIYFSWKEGGFETEMLRDGVKTKPNFFVTPEGLEHAGGKAGKDSTRLKFPQVSGDLNVRWCSAYLKIDVGLMAMRNQSRFIGKRTLVISGERAQESPGRAKYLSFEPDKASTASRHVDHWRPIHQWLESDVWAIIERWKVVVHPCYYLGYGRCSCKWCIFGNENQLAASYFLSPKQGDKIAAYEKQFGKTIKRKGDIKEWAMKGQVYEATFANYGTVGLMAVSETYDGPIFTDHWLLPAGAYGESAGPI